MRGARRGKGHVRAALGGALLLIGVPVLVGCYSIRSRWPLYLDPPPVDRSCATDADCDVLRVDLVNRTCCPTQNFQPLNKDSSERWRAYCEEQGPSQCNWAGGPQGPAAGDSRCVLDPRENSLMCTATTEAAR